MRTCATHTLFRIAPAPPPRCPPERHYGNGRVEIRTYPGITIDDRLRGAATLLAGTGWTIVEEARE